jgi:hypothetical protein
MTPMMFDSPGSGGNVFTLTLFICTLSFPVVCVVSIILSWSFYKSDEVKAALISSLAPLFSLALAAIASVCIDVFRGGLL